MEQRGLKKKEFFPIHVSQIFLNHFFFLTNIYTTQNKTEHKVDFVFWIF